MFVCLLLFFFKLILVAKGLLFQNLSGALERFKKLRKAYKMAAVSENSLYIDHGLLGGKQWEFSPL